MLLSLCLHILLSWNLYLNIWTVLSHLSQLFLQLLLLALGTVKVLGSLVSHMARW